MRNVSEIKNCYGCGVCAITCGKRIIEIVLNKEGFYEPHVINKDLCTSCGLCTEVCAYLHEDLAQGNCKNTHCYAAWSKDAAVRRKCSSGGIGFELGRTLIRKGYKVCGVRYNADQVRAEHYIAITEQELIPSIGSKYIQSYTVEGFKSINRKDKYFVTGTPCQIDSFRRYIQKFKIEDNFVLMDFFCHGVPSMLLWKKYIGEVEREIGKITYVSWRNKFTGWHDSWAMAIDGEEKGDQINRSDSHNQLIRERKSFYNSRLSQGDSFYHFFLSDDCLGRSCYEKCKYKYDCSSADIRIGDLWGETYKSNEDGVSAVITFTEKGEQAIHLVNCELKSHSFSIVAEGQMRKSPRRKMVRKWIIKSFEFNLPLSIIQLLHKLICLPRRVLKKIIRILRWRK